MKTKVIEVTNAPEGMNWGKFLLGRLDNEWRLRSAMPDTYHTPLMAQLGWTRDHLWVLDMQTGEGAFFRPSGYAKADLDKHAIWVCPMFEPFLTWLYEQDLSDLDALPDLVTFTEKEAPSAMRGYRRPGPEERTT
jgi:hypothetical protein